MNVHILFIVYATHGIFILILSLVMPGKGLPFLPYLVSLSFNASEHPYCQEDNYIISTYLSIALVFPLPHISLLVGNSTSGSSGS